MLSPLGRHNVSLHIHKTIVGTDREEMGPEPGITGGTFASVKVVTQFSEPVNLGTKIRKETLT